MKPSLSLIGLVLLFVMWAVRQALAKRRLAEIDEGKRCIACDGSELEHRQGWVRCRLCGHVAQLETLRSVKLTDAEISHVTAPDDKRIDRFTGGPPPGDDGR